jgi:hypothetical protein
MIKFSVTEPGKPVHVIQFFPRRSMTGKWMDDLTNYFVRKNKSGVSKNGGYIRDLNLNEIFCKICKKISSKT